MSTLNSLLSSWRTTNQTGAGGLMEKLTIDGTLYDVKDPGLDYLAEQIESRIAALETITSGTDLTELAQEIQNIISELENSENANAWKTAIDKLAGLGVKTAAVYYTQAECDEYNASLTGFVTAESAVPADYAEKVGTPAAGDTLTTEEANAYNATLEGARKTTDVKTQPVYNTVKDYVDGKVATINAAVADKADAATVTTALAAKADAADFSTGTASYVKSSYSNGNLSITTTDVTVYIPATVNP